MNVPFYIVNAFAKEPFAGNPAAVCLLPKWPDQQRLQQMAKQHNLPVTVFLVEVSEGYELRWITPCGEIPLCGHGTLAASFVVFNELYKHKDRIQFSAVAVPGLRDEALSIPVWRDADRIAFTFPAKNFHAIDVPELFLQSANCVPTAAYTNGERMFLLLENETQVRELTLNFEPLKQLPEDGVVVTARSCSDEYDFVSRTFYPRESIQEDPVTGASHCLLTPFWSQTLGKKTLRAYQASERGGSLSCEYQEERGQVILSSCANLYASGNIHLAFFS